MLQVDIVTPRRQLFKGTAKEVRVPGWEGQFGVLPGHDIYLSLLRAGTCTVVTDASEERFILGRGFAEVGADHVTLLTDVCDRAEDIDKPAAEKDLAEAERLMGTVDPLSVEFDAAREKHELARARLAA